MRLKDGWEEERLLEHIELVQSGVKKFTGLKKYVATGSLETGRINDFVEVSYESRPSRANMEVRENDVLFAKMKDTAKVFLVSREDAENLYSTGFAALRIKDSERILPKYVFFWLKSPFFQNRKNKDCTGATQKAINESKLKKFVIPIHHIEQQKRIVATLEKIEKMKELRAESDNLTDCYLNSVFLKMFGDPVENPHHFRSVKLSSAFTKSRRGLKCGPFGSAMKKTEYTDSGIPVWTMDNIVDGRFSERDCLFVTDEKFEELDSYSVENGDVIISRAGTVGKMCVVDTSAKKSIISTNLIRLSLDRNAINPIYFVCLMEYFKGKIGRLKTGADGSYTFMNTRVLESLEVPLPPVLLQNAFAKVFEQINRIKALQEQTTKTINDLTGVLAQKIFRGEFEC